jgi:GT2 family glycosyltransferase
VAPEPVALRASPEAIAAWLEDAPEGSAVAVLSAAGTEHVPSEVGELLAGPYGIGAVVPGFIGYGRSFRRDVADEPAPAVAVSAGALAGFTPSHRGAGPAFVLGEVLSHVRAKGLRVVSEPRWAAGAPPEPSVLPVGPRRWAGRDRDCPTRVLVVTGTVPAMDARTSGVAELVLLLARCPSTRVTLACADGFGAVGLGPAFARQGVEVVAGPQDWLAWCGDRRYHYSHVLVSDEGLTTRLWALARSTQPQAMGVLYCEELPLRRYAARAAAAQAEGTQTVLEAAHASLLRELAGIEAAWCAHEADAKLLAGLGLGISASVVGPYVPPSPQARGFMEREGVALVATDAFDVAADPEAPATWALKQLVPAWRRRDMGLRVKVVSAWPTPGLAHLVEVAGAELVLPGDDLAAVLSEARLAVGAGTWALAAGTPHLGAAGCEAAGAALGRGWALLTDGAAWSEAACELASLRCRLAAERERSISAALLAAGLGPPGAPAWPVERLAPKPFRRPVRVSPRPASVSDPPAIFVPDSMPEDQRYELWHSRRGPGNPDVVAAIAAEAAGATYKPTISVLMPVCDTDPWMLDAAVASVRAQAYPGWELCMADDASNRPETLAAIEAAARSDPRVKTVRLERRSGISAATNAALKLATGDYVGFLDHDDLLKPHALAQVVRWVSADPDLDLLYSDEDKLDPKGRMTEARWKPDWSPNLLLCQNYVCHFLVVRRSLVERLGGLRSDYDGSQDYDLVLRVADEVPPEHIAHIPDPLYSWRQHERSAASAGDNKPWAWMAAQRALGDWLRRREERGVPGGWTEEGAWFDVHRVRFRRLGEPKVSVIIPTRNGRHLLQRCLESLIWRTVYNNFELVIVDNQSDDPETLEFLATVPGRVLRYPHTFNYARQVNMAAASVECDLLVFLNNDTEVMTADWLDRLIEQAMRPEVGAVGPRLYLPDGRAQHEGILIGMWRGHANSVEWGNWWRMGDLLRDTSAVTGACMATRPGVFFRVGGYDERLRVAYNDVDYCLRLHQAGYQVVYEPDARLYHAEGSTRGLVEDPEDAPTFNERWRPRSSCDPYYNPNLNRNRLLFRVEP